MTAHICNLHTWGTEAEGSCPKQKQELNQIMCLDRKPEVRTTYCPSLFKTCRGGPSHFLRQGKRRALGGSGSILQHGPPLHAAASCRRTSEEEQARQDLAKRKEPASSSHSCRFALPCRIPAATSPDPQGHTSSLKLEFSCCPGHLCHAQYWTGHGAIAGNRTVRESQLA